MYQNATHCHIKSILYVLIIGPIRNDPNPNPNSKPNPNTNTNPNVK